MGNGVFFIPGKQKDSGGTVTAANNGLSLAGSVVQLGQSIGAPGNPAVFLGDREIPMSAYELHLYSDNVPDGIATNAFTFGKPGSGQYGLFLGMGDIVGEDGESGVSGERSAKGSFAEYSLKDGASVPFNGLNYNHFVVRTIVNPTGDASNYNYNGLWLAAQSFPGSGSSATGLITALRIGPQLSGGGTSKVDFTGARVKPVMSGGYSGDVRGYSFESVVGVVTTGLFVAFTNEVGDNYFNHTTDMGSFCRSGFGLFEGYPLTARVHIGAGSAGAGTAPLKLESGTLMTTAEAGAFEYNMPYLYFSPSNSTRLLVTVWDGEAAPAAGRVAYTGSLGRLTTSSGFYYSGNILGNIGPLLARRRVVQSATDPTPILDSNARGVYTNKGASGQISFQLPAASLAGLECIVVVTENYPVQVDVNSGDVIVINSATVANFLVSDSYSVGEYKGATLHLISTDVGVWTAVGTMGTWSGI